MLGDLLRAHPRWTASLITHAAYALIMAGLLLIQRGTMA